MQLNATIRQEDDGSLWADVAELPGCFASGADLNELAEALREAIQMSLEDEIKSMVYYDLNLHFARVAVFA